MTRTTIREDVSKHVSILFPQSRIWTWLALQSAPQVSRDLPSDICPLGCELTDSSLCCHYLLTWVQVLARSPCGRGLISTLPPGIQIILSPAGPEAGLTAIILQSYCILLSMLFCINRRQLSIFDATHALQLVSSPLTMEVVIFSIRGLFGLKYRFIGQLKSHPRIMHTLGALLLPLWFGLNVTLRLSTRAFIDGELCSNPTFEDWSEFFLFVMPTFSDGTVGVLLLSVALAWLLRLVRVLTRQVMTNFQAQEGTSEPQGRSRILRLFLDLPWCISVVLGFWSAKSNTM